MLTFRGNDVSGTRGIVLPISGVSRIGNLGRRTREQARIVDALSPFKKSNSARVGSGVAKSSGEKRISVMELRAMGIWVKPALHMYDMEYGIRNIGRRTAL